MAGSTNVLRPRGIQVERIGFNHAKVVVEPLERGFGHTLGNALRRVLLSSLRGGAVTAVQIDGVLHEFSSIEGVREDVTDIVLNLKKILIVSEKRETVKLHLKVNREGAVTAADGQPFDLARADYLAASTPTLHQRLLPLIH